MYYYDFIVVGAIFLAAIAVLIATRKKLKHSHLHILLVLACGLLLTYYTYSSRAKSNLDLYDRILASDVIEITEPEQKEAELHFENHNLVFLDHLQEAPIFAEKKDVIDIATIKLKQTDTLKHGKRAVVMRFCELQNPDEYPRYVSYEYEGVSYCFLSTKPLYKGVFFILDAQYATQLIQILLESA